MREVAAGEVSTGYAVGEVTPWTPSHYPYDPLDPLKLPNMDPMDPLTLAIMTR